MDIILTNHSFLSWTPFHDVSISISISISISALQLDLHEALKDLWELSDVTISDFDSLLLTEL